MAEWVTQREAADLLGVHHITVAKMVRRGQLTPRKDRRPSLLRTQVVQLAAERAAASAECERRRAGPNRTPAGLEPPDDEHDWLLAPAAAAVLGCTPAALGNRVNRGKVPVTRHDGRRWFRLDLLELVVRSRSAMRARAGRLP